MIEIGVIGLVMVFVGWFLYNAYILIRNCVVTIMRINKRNKSYTFKNFLIEYKEGLNYEIIKL